MAQPPLFVFLTGASGAGKTHLVKEVQEQLGMPEAAYFDMLGIPSKQELIEKFGSNEKWQEEMVNEWVKRMSEMIHQRIFFLEGQFNPQFALDACIRYGVTHWVLLTAHCSRPIRERRLVDKVRRPELVTQEMQDWAEFLRKKTLEIGGEVLDTSSADLRPNLVRVLSLINTRLQTPAFKNI